MIVKPLAGNAHGVRAHERSLGGRGPGGQVRDQRVIEPMTEEQTALPGEGRSARRRGPQPRWVDPDQLEKLAAFGCTIQEVATLFGFKSRTSIKTRIRREPWKSAWQRGQGRARIALRQAQWRAAEAGDSTMLIWLGKQYLGQTDQGPLSAAEGSGPAGRGRRAG
jgi:hypothetical protein